MNMDEIGYNHRHEREFHVERPEGTGDWLMLIIKSPVILRVGEEEIKSPAGTLMIYQPGVPQFYRPDCDEYFDDWIHFLPDDTDIALIRELGLPLNTPAKLTEYTEVSSIVDRMCYEQYSANAYRKETVQLYFRLLLYKLSEKINRGNVPGGDHPKAYVEKLHWIRESIYRWPSREYTVDDMAKDLNFAAEKLNEIYGSQALLPKNQAIKEWFIRNGNDRKVCIIVPENADRQNTRSSCGCKKPRKDGQSQASVDRGEEAPRYSQADPGE